MSIHINARPGQIADTVLFPGDPLRAQFIAENFLTKVEQYNSVRGMLGYTGFTSTGKRVSTQGSGMGMPSLCIYTHELIDYGVKRIIRVGSCGSLQKYIKCRDIIIAIGASHDSAIFKKYFGDGTYAPAASQELLFKAKEVAAKLNIPVKFGNIFSSDEFYDSTDAWKIYAEYNVLAIEMETAALYTLCAKARVEALTINTVSDNLVTEECLSSDDREKTFSDMIKIALNL